MCDCGNNCKIPIGPQGVQGVQGEQGEQGLIGPRGIQGEAGEDGDTIPLDWINLVLINGWQNTGQDTPQYAIRNGWLYIRGTVSPGPATVEESFTNIVLVDQVITTIFNTIEKIGPFFSVPVHSNFLIIKSTAEVAILNYAEASLGGWVLDTVGPISIR